MEITLKNKSGKTEKVRAMYWAKNNAVAVFNSGEILHTNYPQQLLMLDTKGKNSSHYVKSLHRGEKLVAYTESGRIVVGGDATFISIG